MVNWNSKNTYWKRRSFINFYFEGQSAWTGWNYTASHDVQSSQQGCCSGGSFCTQLRRLFIVIANFRRSQLFEDRFASLGWRSFLRWGGIYFSVWFCFSWHQKQTTDLFILSNRHWYVTNILALDNTIDYCNIVSLPEFQTRKQTN